MPVDNLARHAQRKRQTKLTFDSAEPSSSVGGLTQAKVRYEALSSSRKKKSPNMRLQTPSSSQLDGEDFFPSGKNFAVVVETPPSQKKRDGKLPFILASDSSARWRHDRKTRVESVNHPEDSDLDLMLTPSERQRTLEGNPSPFGVELPIPDGYEDLSNLSAGVPSLIHKPNDMFVPRRGFGYDGGMDSSDGSSPEEDAPSTRKKVKKVSTPVVINDSDSNDSLLESPPRAIVKGGKVVLSQDTIPPANEKKTKKEKNMTARSFITGGNSHIAPTNRRKISSVSKTKKKPEDEASRTTPSKTPAKLARGKKSELIELSDDDDDDSTDAEEDIVPITPRPTKVSSGQRKHLILSDHDDSEEPITPIQSAKRSKKTLRKSGTALTAEYLEDNSITSPLSTRKHLTKFPRKFSRVIESDEDDEDDDLPAIADIPTSSARRRQKVPIRQASPSEDEYDDDDEPVLSSPVKRKRQVVSSEGSDDEDAPSPSKRSRVNRGEESGSRDEEDDNDSLPSARSKGKGKAKAPAPKRLTRQQEQQKRKPHRTEKQKNLELLRRRKAGEKITEVTDSDSSDDEVQRGIYDSDSEVAALSEFEDEEDNGIEEVRESIRASNRDNYDDDFVVADEDMPIGVPTHDRVEIPLQFTHAAHKRLEEHFKDAVEWLVQRKINPSFPRNDPIYKQAFRKLDDEVHGYASSKFTSSVWTKSFTRVLWARPMFYMTELSAADRDGLESRKCDACNRSNHTPSWRVQFGDHAYHKDTLEDVEKESNSSSESSSHPSEDEDGSGDESDNSSVDENGMSLPKESKVWFVGRFCMANAEIAHNLIHWKYALNTWVLGQLREEGHLAAQKLAEREPWGEKKRSKYANKIVDGWERTGQVHNLYKTFRHNVEKARDKKQNRFNS